MKTKAKISLAGTFVVTGALILSLVTVAPASAAETSVIQVSLGDSITRGSAIGGGSVGKPIHNELANWSTGTDSRVPSHLQKIKATSKDVVRKNLSVGGTRSDAILG